MIQVHDNWLSTYGVMMTIVSCVDFIVVATHETIIWFNNNLIVSLGVRAMDWRFLTFYESVCDLNSEEATLIQNGSLTMTKLI